MKRFLVWLLTNAVALAIAAWLFSGIGFEGASAPLKEELSDKWLSLLVVAFVMGLVTSFVEPVVKLLSLPFIILTIGLFLLVINALMLQLTAWIVGKLDMSHAFYVDGFWTAFFGAIVISLVTGFIEVAVIGEDE